MRDLQDPTARSRAVQRLDFDIRASANSVDAAAIACAAEGL
jgi:hypothetical protein